MKWKAFEPGSLNALLSRIAQIGKTADRSMSVVSGLSNDFVNMTEITEKELGGKRDKGETVACVLPASGWEQDETESYPYHYDLTAKGITAKDRVTVTLAPASIEIAVNCGLCPTCETLENKIRLRAADAPTEAMAAEYWVEQGKE